MPTFSFTIFFNEVLFNSVAAHLSVLREEHELNMQIVRDIYVSLHSALATITHLETQRNVLVREAKLHVFGLFWAQPVFLIFEATKGKEKLQSASLFQNYIHIDTTNLVQKYLPKAV
jgi:hypothetical protein